MIPGVPYDEELEYLESTGTQYINTGIVPTIDTSCVLDYMDVTFVGWGVILGSATSDNNADSWYLRGNGARPGFSFRIDGKYADQQIFVSLGTRVLCIASKDSFSVDDVTKTIGATAYSSAPTLPMYLFTCNLNGSIWRPCKGRVYSCKIFQGSVLVRHFIPVRVGTEGCLYDRVTRRIFRNAGTGAFVKGPGVARPVLGLHRFVQVQTEEEMYKEMFEAVVCNVPQGRTVRLYDPDITYVGPYFLDNRRWSSLGSMNTGKIEIDFPEVTQIGTGGLGYCFERCGLVSVNLPKLEKMYGTYNFSTNECTEISLPLLQMFGNHDFSFSSTLKTLRLPSVTSKSGTFFVYQDTALENVYLDSMSMATLGVSYVAQQACSTAAVFHCSDGTISYNGSEWVATPDA